MRNSRWPVLSLSPQYFSNNFSYLMQVRAYHKEFYRPENLGKTLFLSTFDNIILDCLILIISENLNFFLYTCKLLSLCIPNIRPQVPHNIILPWKIIKLTKNNALCVNHSYSWFRNKKVLGVYTHSMETIYVIIP